MKHEREQREGGRTRLGKIESKRQRTRREKPDQKIAIREDSGSTAPPDPETLSD
jgi:hypothetical protein